MTPVEMAPENSPPSYTPFPPATVPIDSDGKIRLEIPPDFNEILSSLPVSNTSDSFKTTTTSSSTPTPTRAIPRMNILMLVVGSRGDVQPFLVLARGLRDYGHRVRLATHGIFQRFVESHGIEFFDIGGSPMELMAYMVSNPGLVPKFAAWRNGDVWRKRKMMSEIVHASWRACFEPGEALNTDMDEPLGTEKSVAKKSPRMKRKEKDPVPFFADAIIANPPSLAHVHCAEKLGIPLHIFFTMPWSPTAEMPHPLASVKSSVGQKSQVNAMSYYLVEGLIWQGLGSIVNGFRSKVLQLDPIHPSRAPSLLHNKQIPHTYLWSESVLPRPKDWPGNVAVTGFLSLDGKSGYTPPTALQDFLKAGSPPIYIGFGSIVLPDPEAFFEKVLKAAHGSQNRVILATGWSQASASLLMNNESCLSNTLILQEDCPHDWLFPQMSCVVHHGGAGTTAAGLKAGRSTVIVPFFGDQFFWGERVHQAGAGSFPIPHQELTVENLSEAIYFALRPDTLRRAHDIGAAIRAEDSIEIAVSNFHAHLPQTGLTCKLFPERAATWKVKKTGLLISAVAATVLQRNHLINWNDLELHRKFDLDVSHGPYEPASGAAWAITELLLDSFRGMGEILAEVGNWPVITYRAGEKIKTRFESPLGQRADFSLDVDGKQLPARPKKRSRLPGEYFFTGSARICKAAARAPGEFAAAMANGSHDLPKLWGDKTIRAPTKITGVGSGMAAGCKELFWGVADGISGVFVQPVTGLMKEGPVGLAKGTASGFLGLPVKFFAAASGIVGYPLKGIDLAVSRALSTDGIAAVKFHAKLQGEHEFASPSEQAKADIINRWRDFVVERAQ